MKMIILGISVPLPGLFGQNDFHISFTVRVSYWFHGLSFILLVSRFE